MESYMVYISHIEFEEDAYYEQRNIPLNIQDLERERNNFINHVEKTLKRFHDQGLAVREFKLGIEHSDSKSINPRIDYWMRLAKESGVQELELRLNDYSNDCCCLPPCILEAKSLTKLSLCSLKIENAIMKNQFRFLHCKYYIYF
ncbi:hypothetical protein L6164_020971 [Bauhinia variegata]|uniref:Uncharacterized protein n=1 Tax=Bauhinia variegata TaxID=167791 RepID=A0ACB9MXJ6_BAUVA|nr:hypothetical protein L6164_020971 [Bauhinia variegata]